jgi:HK97 family phage major capsid protein
MGTNESYLEKADLAVSDLASGGLLNPEQSKKFMELLILGSTLLPLVTTVTMANPTYEISKMGFTGRVLRRAQESTALLEADRAKPVLDKVTLTTEELIAEARIPYSVVEDNIEQNTFTQTLLSYMVKAVSRDFETLLIQGDTASTDPLLNSFDGILKQISSYVVNAGGVRLTKAPLKTLSQSIPSQYRDNLVFLASPNAIIDYNDSLSNRQTPLGDDALLRKPSGEYNGRPIYEIPLMPENLGGTTDRSNVLLLDPKNIHVGMHRAIRVESERDISSRLFKIVISMRVGVKLAHEPATAKATEILAAAG